MMNVNQMVTQKLIDRLKQAEETGEKFFLCIHRTFFGAEYRGPYAISPYYVYIRHRICVEVL